MDDSEARLEASRRAQFERDMVHLWLGLRGSPFEGAFTIGCYKGAFSVEFGQTCNSHPLLIDLSADDWADIARILRRGERRSRASRTAGPVSPSVSQGDGPVPAPLPSST